MTPSNLEALADMIGWLMIAIGVISLLYPWRPDQPFASKLIHLPLVIIPLWISYEVLMPAHMNIRADLLLLPPFFLLILVIWAIKVTKFRKLKGRSEPPDQVAK